MIALLPVVLATGWVAILVTSPVLPVWAGAVAYGLGSFICHQLPERSFHVAGFQLPVCARCLGIYAGVAAGTSVMWARSLTGRGMVPMARGMVRRVAALAAVPTLLTVALETAGAWHPSNAIRAWAGIPLGGLVALVVMSALATLTPQRAVE